MKSVKLSLILVIGLALLATQCGEKPKQGQAEDSSSSGIGSKGIGPVSKVEVGPLNDAMAESGKKTFESKCLACHKFEEKVVGPPLKDVTKKRSPEWIMNMILNPEEMIKKDPAAMELYATYLVPMTFQNVTEKETRDILEYFRKVDSK